EVVELFQLLANTDCRTAPAGPASAGAIFSWNLLGRGRILSPDSEAGGSTLQKVRPPAPKQAAFFVGRAPLIRTPSIDRNAGRRVGRRRTGARGEPQQ